VADLKSVVEFAVTLLTVGAWVIVVLMLPDAKNCAPGAPGQGRVHPSGVPAYQPIDGCGNGADRRISMPRLDERRSP
jgi:hypothetical protein